MTPPRPRAIAGPAKLAVDLRIAARIASLWLANALGPRRPARLRLSLSGQLGSLATTLAILRQKKYSRFRGKVFFDVYSPRFPSPLADRLIRGSVLGLDENGRTDCGFIPNLDLAITGRCMFRCEHCYASDALVKKDTVSLQDWLTLIDRFQEIGVAVVSLVGGEPLLRFDDMLRIIEHASKKSDIWTVTTGVGLTSDKAKALAEAGLSGAAVGLDHWEPAKHNSFRRNAHAFDWAVRSLELFAEAGIFPAIAICAVREVLNEESLDRFLGLARSLGAGIVQILEPIRSGAYLHHQDAALTEGELRWLQSYQRMVNHHPRYRDHPAVSSRTSHKDSDIGVGCGAGGNNFLYVDPAGNLQPCPLLNLTTGNLVRDGFDTPWKRMRSLFPHASATGPVCPANALHSRIAEACTRTGLSLPLPYEETARICEGFRHAPLPALLGGDPRVRMAFPESASPEVEACEKHLPYRKSVPG